MAKISARGDSAKRKWQRTRTVQSPLSDSKVVVEETLVLTHRGRLLRKMKIGASPGSYNLVGKRDEVEVAAAAEAGGFTEVSAR